MKVFLISGKAQHGKDYSANLMKQIAQEHNKKCLIIHFADMVKYVCKSYFGWNGEKDMPGRSLLQKVGTDMRLQRDPTIWSQITSRLISFLGPQYDYVIIPDWRFILQYQIISKSFDVQTIRIVRYNSDNKQTIYQNTLTPEQKNHISQTQLDTFDFDYIIDNWGNSWYNNDKEKITKFKEIMV